MPVQTKTSFSARINEYIEGESVFSPFTLTDLARNFSALPADEQKKLLNELRMRRVVGEYKQRRFVELLFHFGDSRQLKWQQPNTYRHLRGFFELHASDTGCAEVMIPCFRELVLEIK